MNKINLIKIINSDDISAEIRDTPVGDLLRTHNLGVKMREFDKPELLICACMDYRVKFNIPERSAFIVRTPGANLLDSEFGLATAVSLAGIRAVAIIGHTDCAMTKLDDNQEKFVEGLTQAGWSEESAKDYYDQHAKGHSISDPSQFVVDQCKRLRKRYDQVLFAPLLYDVSDGMFSQIVE